METLLFFMSGFILGIAITYLYYDAKIQRLHTLFVMIESSLKDKE